MPLQPAYNDVVVRHKRGGGREQFVIRTVAGPDQLQMFGRDKAVAHAVAFARYAHLCAWINEDAGGPVLLASFRDDGPVVLMATKRQWRPVAI